MVSAAIQTHKEVVKFHLEPVESKGSLGLNKYSTACNLALLRCHLISRGDEDKRASMVTEHAFVVVG